MDRNMSAEIEKLVEMIVQLTHESSELSALTYQSPLTQKFIAKAEKWRRQWFSFGFGGLLRAGQW